MSDEFGLTNVGSDGVVSVPVETKAERIVPEVKLEAPVIEKRKRGRPRKVVEEVVPEREWYCSTCRETIADHNAMKIGVGTNRWAVFCPQCQRSFGFLDQAMLDKVAKLIRDNPTK